MHNVRKHVRGKQRITVSLSADAREYLEAARTEAKAPSTSAYIESLILERLAQAETANREAAMTAYYDNLSADEIAEQSDWGEIGVASLARLED